MFDKPKLKALLLPLILEQVLTAFMGMADTMMVANVSEAALSAVALVDSINVPFLNLFSALSTGGVIVCSQYLGRKDPDSANAAARQAVLASFTLSVFLALFCTLGRRPILRLIYGSVDEEVMRLSLSYFQITVLSYPALALQQTSAALFRADGRAKPPMVVSACANAVNVAGNAILIFGFDLSVTGAALSTLFSRILSAVVLLYMLRSPHLTLRLDHYLSIRPQWSIIKAVLRIGIPSGVENFLFHVGKLTVQSTVSTLGTTAIAAQAMTITLDNFQSTPCQAAGLALMTVAGQCMGAGRPDEAKRHTKTLCLWSEGILAVSSGLVLAAYPLVVRFSSMSAESSALAWKLLLSVTIFKMFSWVIAFILPNTLRASGDVAFSATVSGVSMWLFRVGLSTMLVRVFSFGLEAIWFGWCVDWLFRDICYLWRFFSGRWAKKQVLR